MNLRHWREKGWHARVHGAKLSLELSEEGEGDAGSRGRGWEPWGHQTLKSGLFGNPPRESVNMGAGDGCLGWGSETVTSGAGSFQG